MTATSITRDSFDDRVNAAGRRVISAIAGQYKGRAAMRLWTGEIVIGSSNAECIVNFHHPSALRTLVLNRDLVPAAETYLAGIIDFEGNIEALFDLVEYLRVRHLPWSERLGMALQALKLPRDDLSQQVFHTLGAGEEMRANSRRSISHHYDVSNAFYQLWLDPNMVYSCAYFSDAQQDLAAAQEDKLDMICRKLRLQPGQKLLDIGCGWGALVCWAASHYGVEAHGITLSTQQHDYARDKIRLLGLQDRAHVELRDYRDLPDEPVYDRISSIGMFEHVGISNFPVYFGKVRAALKPDGLFLNHGITNDTGWVDNLITRFINRYVFPDGELTRISEVMNAMEDAGFEIQDVESLRRHYALTLRHWIRSLEENHEAAVKLTSEATYRLWRLYMGGSAFYFDEGSTGVYQILANPALQQPSTPLRRDDIYL